MTIGSYKFFLNVLDYVKNLKLNLIFILIVKKIINEKFIYGVR